jgi:ferredoxin
MRAGLVGLGLSFLAMGIVGLFFGSIILGGFGLVFLVLAPIFMLLGLLMPSTPEAFPPVFPEPLDAETHVESIPTPSPIILPATQRSVQFRTRTGDERNLRVTIDWDKCMGAGSCVIVAPSVFQLDEKAEKSVFISRAALRVKDPDSVDNETMIIAAQSCPYSAIIVEDEKTGERIHPR